MDRVDQTSEQQLLLANAAAAAQSMRQEVQALLEAVSVFRLPGSRQSGVDAVVVPGAAAVRRVRIAARRA